VGDAVRGRQIDDLRDEPLAHVPSFADAQGSTSRVSPDARIAASRWDEAMKITSHIALLAAVAVAAVAAGCGGGSAASSAGPSPVLPHDRLIAEADRICGAYSHTITVEFRDVSSNDEAAKLWITHLGQFDQLIRDLRALRPSSQDAAAYAAWLDAGEKQRPLIVAARPPSRDEATGKLVLAVANVNVMAARLGMRDCSIDIDLSE